MKQSEKRTDDMAPQAVQEASRTWWTSNPMTYDWRGDLQPERLSREWFDAVDARFIYGSRLFATHDRPFDLIMPLDELAGKRVLEIGCGMGLHTETMARAGADVTAVDLTPTACEATTQRLRLKGLKASVRIADAENLPFDDDTFDFVWSWGVIHHSSRTARIVRQIARVLKPEGSCRIMVYNRAGTAAQMAIVKDHILRGRFLKQSIEETLFRSTDGFSARYYVKEQFEDLFRGYFRDVSSEIVGQDSDVVPLPRQLRALVTKVLSESYLKRAQARRGGFLFLQAAHKE